MTDAELAAIEARCRAATPGSMEDTLLTAHARGYLEALCAEVRRLTADRLPLMCRNDHPEIRHRSDGELCPACEARGEADHLRDERDDARAEVRRLSDALDAAARIVKRKADRAAWREET